MWGKRASEGVVGGGGANPPHRESRQRCSHLARARAGTCLMMQEASPCTTLSRTATKSAPLAPTRTASRPRVRASCVLLARTWRTMRRATPCTTPLRTATCVPREGKCACEGASAKRALLLLPPRCRLRAPFCKEKRASEGVVGGRPHEPPLRPASWAWAATARQRRAWREPPVGEVGKRARGGGEPPTPPGCTSTTVPVGACAKSSKPSPCTRRYSDGSTISATCDVCPAGT